MAVRLRQSVIMPLLFNQQNENAACCQYSIIIGKIIPKCDRFPKNLFFLFLQLILGSQHKAQWVKLLQFSLSNKNPVSDLRLTSCYF